MVQKSSTAHNANNINNKGKNGSNQSEPKNDSIQGVVMTKDSNVQIRLSSDEKKEWEKLAQDEELSMTKFVITCVNEHKERKDIRQMIEELFEKYFELYFNQKL